MEGQRMLSYVRMRVAGVVALALGSLVVMGGTAWAKPTQCSGGQVIESTTISGNLSVGPGACTLKETTVTGAVAVQPGAELFATGGNFNSFGALSATQETVVSVEGITVNHSVNLLESASVTLFGVQIKENLVARKSTGNVLIASVGNVAPEQGKVIVRETVGGSVLVADVAARSLTIANNVVSELTEEESALQENLLVSGNQAAHIDVGYRDYVNDSMSILRNQASEYIKVNAEEASIGNLFAGGLRCFGNSPAPIGAVSPETEHKEGQCKNL